MRSVSSFPRPPGGAFIGTNVEYALFQWAIPFIHVSSGTIGNNGALSAITALPTTYSGGAWVLYPAGAIAAGVPAAAAWLWTVFSSTSAGTIYNSTYTTGLPRPGTQTAFVTTGPGAYTGSTSQVNGPQLTIPANVMGANGYVKLLQFGVATNNANAKNLFLVDPGGSASFVNQNLASVNEAASEGIVFNRGVTNSQVNQHITTAGVLQTSSTETYTAVDTTAAWTSKYQLLKATATDNLILEGGIIRVGYAP